MRDHQGRTGGPNSGSTSNGTFVTIAGQSEDRIHDQELALGKSGLIALGQSAPTTEHVISYVCEGGAA